MVFFMKWILFYSRLSYIAAFMFFNPLTPMSDQDRISLYTINTILTRLVVRIKKNFNLGIIS